MASLGRMLLVVGLVFVVLGIVFQLVPGIPWLGRLPGDIRIERPGFRLYFPLVTSLLLSLVLSAILWLFSRGR